MTTDLHPCPKCHAPMRTIERSGIHLEICPDCRGIFLDRGELDRLLDLEAASLRPRVAADASAVAPVPLFDASMPASPVAGPWQARDPQWDRPAAWDDRRRHRFDDDDDDDWDDRDRDDRDDRYERGRRRRGGFLAELLEGLSD